MPRPSLALGEWGDVSVAKAADGKSYRARARFRDFDGVVRMVERRAATAKAARADLDVALRERARTGQGVGALMEEIRATLSERVGEEGTIAHARQRQATQSAAEALARAAGLLRDGDLDLAAEEVRAALRSLDFLLGRVDVEAVLDIIFASFCLGK